MIASAIGVLCVLRQGQDIQRSADLLSKVRLGFLIPAFACGGAFVAGEAANLYLALRMVRSPIRGSEAFICALTGFFFSGITPGASGGQPMQLYQMRHFGISLPSGAAALLLELISAQTAITILGSIGFFFHLKEIQSVFPLLKWLAVGSVLLNGVRVFLMLSLLIKQDWTCRLYLFAARRLDGCRFLSPEKKTQRKCSVKRQLRDFRSCGRMIGEERCVLLKMLAVSSMQMVCFFSIPYFACCGMEVHGASYGSLLLMQAVLYSAVSVIPLPGAAGGSEVGFLLLFGALIPREAAAPVMLCSRGISFYLLMAFAALLLGSLYAVRTLSGNKRNQSCLKLIDK